MPDTAVSADLHKTADAAAGGDTAPGARKRPRLAAGPARIHALPRELEALLDAGGVTEAERKALLDGALLAPRYIRVKRDASVDLAELAADLGTPLKAVPYLPRYYELAEDRPVAATAAYKAGLIFGGDVSSGVAVAALAPQPGDDCLDLCCAPGVKMAAIAEAVAPDGSVTGVDIDKARLAACGSLLRKYRLPRIRLYRADGRTFSIEAPPLGTRDKATLAACADRSGTATKPYYASAFLRACPDRSGRLYDRVLVDAECTHDGSPKHLLKAQAHGWTAFVTRGLDPARVAALPELQGALLRRGFELVRPGGTVVYATCSLTRTQNEQVVAAFLASTPAARLVPSGVTNLPVAAYQPWPPGAAPTDDGDAAAWAARPHVLRFDGSRTRTSGLFVAKFERVVPGE